MTIRAIPCPMCRRTPETRRMEGCLGFSTECPRCGGLCAFGNTEDDSRRCWNHCAEEEMGDGLRSDKQAVALLRRAEV